jgi:Uma2 family endonuclease
LNSQIAKWSNIHRKDKGFIGNVFGGFAFGGYDHREYQLIPDASYVDQQTALTISPRDCQKAYVPCVPTVVIQIVSEVDDISQLKKKMSIFLKHGTREGLIVDSQRNEMWIYNSRFRFPSKHSLGTVIFDYWPGFELDCKAIREFRKHFLDSL